MATIRAVDQPVCCSAGVRGAEPGVVPDRFAADPRRLGSPGFEVRGAPVAQRFARVTDAAAGRSARSSTGLRVVGERPARGQRRVGIAGDGRDGPRHGLVDLSAQWIGKDIIPLGALGDHTRGTESHGH